MNLNDVESIEVIKDASAAAIYGANAAGGVILITTKKGLMGRPTVSFSSKNTFSTVGNKYYHLLETPDFIAARREAFGENYVEYNDAAVTGVNTNWGDVLGLTGHGYNQQYTLAVSGADERFNYYVSGQYQRQDGLQTDWWQYISALAKMEYKVARNATLGARVNRARTTKNSYTVGWRTMMRTVPFLDPVAEDGSFNPFPAWYSNAGENYLADLSRNGGHRDEAGVSTNGRLYFDWEILPGLKYNITGSASFGGSYSDVYTPENNTKPTASYDSYNKNQSYSENYRVFTTLTYDKVIADIHELSLMAGYEAGWWMSNGIDITAKAGSGNGFVVSDPKSYSVGSSLTYSNVKATLNKNGRQLSQFARLNYALLGRYLLTANVRRDGSTKFGRNNRFGIFPSVSAGWKISEEPWFKDLGADWVSLVKPRISWGVLGNTDALANYSYLKEYTGGVAGPAYSFDGSSINTGYVSAKLINNDIKWEEVRTFDVGIDINLFKDRLEFAFDWYNRNSKDMLYNLSAPTSSGIKSFFYGNQWWYGWNTGSMPLNIGSVSNKGIEFSISWRDRVGDFHYGVSFNGAHNVNKVIDIGEETASILTGTLNLPTGGVITSPSKTVNDSPMGMLWGLRTDGIIQTQAEIDALNALAKEKGFDYYYNANTGVGDLKYVDVDEDGHITKDDADFIGNPWPKFQYGGNVYFEWKGIDLSANFVGVHGRDVMNGMIPWTFRFQSDYNTTYDIFKTSYFKGNGLTEYPRIYAKVGDNTYSDPNMNYGNTSDFLVEDGSYFKVKNITLGYSLPTRIIEKINLSRARIYFSGHNLVTLTRFTGLDPEFVGSPTNSGYYEESTPLTKYLTVGLDITFSGRHRGVEPRPSAAAPNARMAEALAAANALADRLRAENDGLKRSLKEADDELAACRAAAPKNMAQKRAEALLVEDIYFELDQYVVRPSEMPKVDALIRCMKDHPEANVSIFGYADQATGTESRNLVLTKERALVVANALKAAGIDESRISTEFYGTEKDPSFSPENNRLAVCIVK